KDVDVESVKEEMAKAEAEKSNPNKVMNPMPNKVMNPMPNKVMNPMPNKMMNLMLIRRLPMLRNMKL
ncbi:MAG: hypothetical protein U9N83_13935, partial [Thermodesulfobacteriota bacterium]|nr:hypothetical protein [Thermodesulfobacteriota bacterium]